MRIQLLILGFKGLTKSFMCHVCRVVCYNQLRDWQARRTTSLPLKAMQERNLCSQGIVLWQFVCFLRTSSRWDLTGTERTCNLNTVHKPLTLSVPGGIRNASSVSLTLPLPYTIACITYPTLRQERNRCVGR